MHFSIKAIAITALLPLLGVIAAPITEARDVQERQATLPGHHGGEKYTDYTLGESKLKERSGTTGPLRIKYKEYNIDPITVKERSETASEDLAERQLDGPHEGDIKYGKYNAIDEKRSETNSEPEKRDVEFESEEPMVTIKGKRDYVAYNLCDKGGLCWVRYRDVQK